MQERKESLTESCIGWKALSRRKIPAETRTCIRKARQPSPGGFYLSVQQKKSHCAVTLSETFFRFFFSSKILSCREETFTAVRRR